MTTKVLITNAETSHATVDVLHCNADGAILKEPGVTLHHGEAAELVVYGGRQLLIRERKE